MPKHGPDVEIEYPDGRRYMVTPADFHHAKVVEGKDGKLQTHEEAGAKILHWNNGEPYQEEKKAAPKKAEATEVTHG